MPEAKPNMNTATAIKHIHRFDHSIRPYETSRPPSPTHAPQVTHAVSMAPAFFSMVSLPRCTVLRSAVDSEGGSSRD